MKIIVPETTLEFDKKFLRTVLRQAGQQVIKSAKALIKSGAGVSEPGEAPNSQTGNLVKSLKVKAGRGLSVTVSDNAFYALALESGAVGGGRTATRNKVSRRNGKRTVIEAGSTRVLQARPFLSTALQNNEQSITEQIIEAIDNGIDLKTLAKTK